MKQKEKDKIVGRKVGNWKRVRSKDACKKGDKKGREKEVSKVLMKKNKDKEGTRKEKWKEKIRWNQRIFFWKSAHASTGLTWKLQSFSTRKNLFKKVLFYNDKLKFSH